MRAARRDLRRNRHVRERYAGIPRDAERVAVFRGHLTREAGIGSIEAHAREAQPSGCPRRVAHAPAPPREAQRAEPKRETVVRCHQREGTSVTAIDLLAASEVTSSGCVMYPARSNWRCHS